MCDFCKEGSFVPSNEKKKGGGKRVGEVENFCEKEGRKTWGFYQIELIGISGD